MDIENSLDSLQYVNWGTRPNSNPPQSFTYPRRCHCGYPLKPGEYASYLIGRWRCPQCIKDDDQRLGYGEAQR